MSTKYNLQAIALLLSGSRVLAQNLNKPVLFSDGLSPHVDSVFWQHLAPTHSTWDEWGWGWIPQACLNVVQGTSFSPYDMEIYNVHYDDCGSAWVICRHHNAQMSVIDIIDVFGRVPVQDRDWTQHVVALPADAPSAETGGAVTTFHGDCYVPSIAIHEMTHTLDAYVNDVTGDGTGQSSNGPFSASSQYKQAVAKDSCVPDPYANTNYQEDYAQVSVLAMYEKVNPGGLDPIGSWRCLVNSKNSLDTTIGREITPGGKCTRRWADSTIVSMGPAAGNKKRSLWSKRSGRKVGPKPEPANKAGDALVNGTMSQPPAQEAHFKRRVQFQNLVRNQTERRQAAIRQNKWNSQVGKATLPVPAA
ncbi:hypothetical protein F5884DRAFT_261915 [Xylogone sp. PMI_703]|nr:hypothetical protein F5884DRAFT_261915 [Xylogone sp. PMI_703]